MSLRYVKGSYMDEILVNGNPVLVVLEGLEEERMGMDTCTSTARSGSCTAYCQV